VVGGLVCVVWFFLVFVFFVGVGVWGGFVVGGGGGGGGE